MTYENELNEELDLDLLDDLSSIWQSEDEPIEWMREDFHERMRKDAWQYYSSAGALVFSLIVVFVCCMFLISKGRYLMPVVALWYMPLGSYMLYKIRKFWLKRYVTLPLSPRSYLKNMYHNVEVQEQELRWAQNLFPFTTLFVIIVSGWAIFLKGSFLLAVFFAVFLPLQMGYAAYTTFVSGPRKIRTEREKLDEISQDFLGS